jgi:hypothetical protein
LYPTSSDVYPAPSSVYPCSSTKHQYPVLSDSAYCTPSNSANASQSGSAYRASLGPCWAADGPASAHGSDPYPDPVRSLFV